MARSHLTLAALATSAVPGLEVAGAARVGSPGGAFDSAQLVGADDRHWIIRVPRTPDAEVAQAADLLALRALTTGVRERLPFAVTTPAGQVAVDGTRAVVYEFLGGAATPLARADLELASSLGAAIAAIHSLPTGFVTEAGLPALSQVHALQTSLKVVDSAIETGLLPAALKDRWQRALADDRLWQFQPTVVHGSLGAATVLHHDHAVVGILGWQELRVADPAKDLAWLLGGRRSDVADAAFDSYLLARGSGDRQLRSRATLYAELEIAKWLLHGTEAGDSSVVDDAVQLLHGLVDDVQGDLMNPLGPITAPIMAIQDVEAMLDSTEVHLGADARGAAPGSAEDRLRA